MPIVTYLIEYLGEFEFIFETILDYESGDQMGSFDAKNPPSKISCLGTFKELLLITTFPHKQYAVLLTYGETYLRSSDLIYCCRILNKAKLHHGSLFFIANFKGVFNMANIENNLPNAPGEKSVCK
jgi:hypothetical protein